MTERILSQVQASEMDFFNKGMTLNGKGHSSAKFVKP